MMEKVEPVEAAPVPTVSVVAPVRKDRVERCLTGIEEAMQKWR